MDPSEQTGQDPDVATVTLWVIHNKGRQNTYRCDLPPDGKTEIYHAKGAPEPKNRHVIRWTIIGLVGAEAIKTEGSPAHYLKPRGAGGAHEPQQSTFEMTVSSPSKDAVCRDAAHPPPEGNDWKYEFWYSSALMAAPEKITALVKTRGRKWVRVRDPVVVIKTDP